MPPRPNGIGGPAPGERWILDVVHSFPSSVGGFIRRVLLSGNLAAEANMDLADYIARGDEWWYAWRAAAFHCKSTVRIEDSGGPEPFVLNTSELGSEDVLGEVSPGRRPRGWQPCFYD